MPCSRSAVRRVNARTTCMRLVSELAVSGSDRSLAGCEEGGIVLANADRQLRTAFGTFTVSAPSRSVAPITSVLISPDSIVRHANRPERLMAPRMVPVRSRSLISP